MIEIFKDIPTYEGRYQVSNFGNVKSLSRIAIKKDGKIQDVKEILLKQANNRQGYKVVGLNKNGKLRTYHVHQLIAMAFLNHKPNGNKIVVDHINNIKADNRLSNLQLITHRKNLSKNKKGYTSSYVGVSWHKTTKRWSAQAVINGKSKNLGYFNNEIEASNAYQKEIQFL